MDPVVDSILNGEKIEEYKAAKRIWESPVKKSYVESCMLATQDLQEISDALEIPVEVLDIYRQIFFDVVSFNKLDKLEVLEEAATDEERAMKTWAVSQGMQFLNWRLGKNTITNPVAGLQEMFTMCMNKSKEALFSGNVAESSKESAKWVKLSMDLGRLLKAFTTDSHAARGDLEMALQSVLPDFGGFSDLDM
jgi:hypothetical protein